MGFDIWGSRSLFPSSGGLKTPSAVIWVQNIEASAYIFFSSSCQYNHRSDRNSKREGEQKKRHPEGLSAGSPSLARVSSRYLNSVLRAAPPLGYTLAMRRVLIIKTCEQCQNTPEWERCGDCGLNGAEWYGIRNAVPASLDYLRQAFPYWTGRGAVFQEGED